MEEVEEAEPIKEQPPAANTPAPNLHNNFAMIMKAKSEEPTHTLRRCLTLSDKSESEEAADILGDMNYDRIKPAKRSRTKWIAAAVCNTKVSKVQKHFARP